MYKFECIRHKNICKEICKRNVARLAFAKNLRSYWFNEGIGNFTKTFPRHNQLPNLLVRV